MANKVINDKVSYNACSLHFWCAVDIRKAIKKFVRSIDSKNLLNKIKYNFSSKRFIKTELDKTFKKFFNRLFKRYFSTS